MTTPKPLTGCEVHPLRASRCRSLQWGPFVRSARSVYSASERPDTCAICGYLAVIGDDTDFFSSDRVLAVNHSVGLGSDAKDTEVAYVNFFCEEIVTGTFDDEGPITQWLNCNWHGTKLGISVLGRRSAEKSLLTCFPPPQLKFPGPTRPPIAPLTAAAGTRSS